jgi:thiol-disulfide isomerase/thioredoxin
MHSPFKDDLKGTHSWIHLVAAVLMLSSAATTAGVAANLQAGGAAEKIGTPETGFDVQSLGGTNLRLADLKGKVVVLNFWFIACPPCRVEIPKLNQLVEEYREAEVVFIAFVPDFEDDLREFPKKTAFEYHIIPNSTPVAESYEVTGAPTHILTDREGGAVDSSMAKRNGPGVRERWDRSPSRNRRKEGPAPRVPGVVACR